MQRKYTKELLESVVPASRSYRDVVIRLGVIPHGGSIYFITKYIHEYGINCDHFSCKAWNRGLPALSRRKASEILLFGKEEEACRLKRALIEVGVENKCAVCGIVSWNEKPIHLEIDHIDGNRKNNLVENLRFICPNCHSQTNNYKFYGRKHVYEGKHG